MRDKYFDSWRGVCILAVIIIHCSASTGTFAPYSVNWYFGLILRQILNFTVPVFLALAGFFAARKPINTIAHFYKDRLQYLVPAYLCWTLIYICIKTPTHLLSPHDLFDDVFLGRGIGIGYFVIVLIQFTLIHPWLIKIKEKRHHLIIMVLGLIVAMALSYWVRIGQPESLWATFPYYCVLFIVWYPFYHLGIFCSLQQKDNNKGRIFNIYDLIMLAVALTVFAIFEGIYWAQQGYYAFGASQIKLSSYLASTVLSAIAVKHFKNAGRPIKSTVLPWLGAHSFIIYVSHMIFAPVVQISLKRSIFIFSIQPIFIGIATVLTLGCCIILIKWMNYFLPETSFRKYLGL
jgi:surface polysaccharide O-acyltransferase-like enzyme